MRSIAPPLLQGLPAPWPDVNARALHELRVQQIELEMQNEELQRRQLELNAAKTRYQDLYDQAPVGYIAP